MNPMDKICLMPKVSLKFKHQVMDNTHNIMGVPWWENTPRSIPAECGE